MAGSYDYIIPHMSQNRFKAILRLHLLGIIIFVEVIAAIAIIGPAVEAFLKAVL